MEAPDPAALARFHAGLLGWPIAPEHPGTTVIGDSGGSFVVVQRSEGYRPPVWPPGPDDQHPMVHVDVQVGDLDEARTEAVALSATVAEHQPQEDVRVMLDPAGHPFCLCVELD